MSLSRTMAALVVGLLFASGLTACSGGDATRDESSLEVIEGGDADVFSLQLGDCFNNVSSEEVSEVPVVPCSEAHDNEVFHIFEVPDGDFPGDEALDEAAAEECVPAFESFVGIAYMDSGLDYFPLTPTEAGWTVYGDREIVCSVYDPDASVTGSLVGAAR